MTDAEREFLKLIRRSISRESCGSVKPLSGDDASAIISMAKKQNVAPLLYDALKSAGGLESISADRKTALKDYVLEAATRQITQNNEFLTILLHAQEQGLDPIVIKGVISRSLYPIPYLRPSVDEDILVSEKEAEKYHGFLLSEGLCADETELTADEHRKAYELSYHRENSPTYIEMHKALFDPESPAFDMLNDLFIGFPERTVRVQIEDVSVRTLAPTDHLLYLILHAFKHFLHSGVGIRPLCDIGLFADRYSDQVSWQEIQMKLASVNVLYYAKALFRIIQLHLLPDAAFLDCIRDWKIEEIEVDALLGDTLASGVYGTASLSRLHSSSMTLYAFENQKRSGNKGGAYAVMHSVLLPKKNMEERYTYLKRRPALLPVAWVQRAVRYLLETRKKDTGFEADNNAAESIRLGRERIGLLRQYRIIE